MLVPVDYGPNLLATEVSFFSLLLLKSMGINRCLASFSFFT